VRVEIWCCELLMGVWLLCGGWGERGRGKHDMEATQERREGGKEGRREEGGGP